MNILAIAAVSAVFGAHFAPETSFQGVIRQIQISAGHTTRARGERLEPAAEAYRRGLIPGLMEAIPQLLTSGLAIKVVTISGCQLSLAVDGRAGGT